MIKTKYKIPQAKNYSIIEKEGKYYMANPSKTKYYPDTPYETEEKAKEEILIEMLLETKRRMAMIELSLEEFGWDEFGRNKNINDLLA